ncbi:MAG: PAS domain S-box protein, partial [Acidobacteriota bacterium]
MGEAEPLVLLVDDDDAGRYATGRILRRQGFEVLEEGTGEGALVSAERYHPDLIVLDVNLPDLSGFEVCRRLKASPATASIPVLHLSATHLNPDAVAHGLETAEGYLTQPVDPAVLVATVKALLRLKRQEKDLAAERSRFQVLAETAATAIFLYQEDRFVYANPACERLTGYGTDELVGMPFLRLIHPEDREMVKARAEARLRGEAVLNKYEFRIVTKEGKTRWIFFTAGRSEYEGRMAVIGTAIDITEQKKASERLERSEETFRLLFQSHPHPMWVYDRETLGFLEVNDAAVEKYGYSREEFLSMTLKEISPPEEVPRLEEDLRKSRAVLEHSGPWVHLLRGGRRIEVEIHSHTLTFEGRPAVLVVAEDVTEKLAARRDLEASERRFRTLVESAQEGIMAVDRVGRVTFANGRMADMLGQKRKELLGQDVFSLIHPEERQDSMDGFLLRKAGKSEGKEVRFLRSDGMVVPAYAILTPLLDGAGNFDGVVGLHLDLREKKRLEEELQRARTLETIGMIAGGVAHEVRNPLFALQTVAAALHQKLGGREEYAEY